MAVGTEPPKDREEFSKEVAEWLDANINPDMKYFRDVQKMSREQFQMHRDLARGLGAKGWLYPTHPREYGGGGHEGELSGVVSQELAKRRLALPIIDDWTTLATPAILARATEDQKRRFLPAMLRGEALTWQLFTEPEAGTDVANQQINAIRHTRDGEYFVVNGQKIFVGGIHPPPDQFFLMTRSDAEAPRHENLSGFIIPANLPGISIQPLDLFVLSTLGAVSGLTGAIAEGQKNSVFFDDVRVHESCLIGKEGDGWDVIQATFAVEHGGGFRRSTKEAAGDSSGAVVSEEARLQAEEAERERRWTGGQRDYLVEQFLAQCKNNPNIVKRLKENPKLIDHVVSAYIFDRIHRSFHLRNSSGVGDSAYAGPQTTLYHKVGGAQLIADMAEVLGPFALADDDEWILDEGIHEVGQRCGICLAPGGTPEAMKIIISRALAIGR